MTDDLRRVTLAYNDCMESTYSTLLYKTKFQYGPYVCMYGHTYSKSMDQLGKIANPSCGHLISVLCVFFQFILDVKFVWVVVVVCCFSHSAYWLPTRKNYFTRWPIPLVVC